MMGEAVDRVGATLEQTSVSDDATAAIREVVVMLRELAGRWNSSDLMDAAAWFEGTL